MLFGTDLESWLTHTSSAIIAFMAGSAAAAAVFLPRWKDYRAGESANIVAERQARNADLQDACNRFSAFNLQLQKENTDKNAMIERQHVMYQEEREQSLRLFAFCERVHGTAERMAIVLVRLGESPEYVPDLPRITAAHVEAESEFMCRTSAGNVALAKALNDSVDMRKGGANANPAGGK